MAISVDKMSYQDRVHLSPRGDDNSIVQRTVLVEDGLQTAALLATRWRFFNSNRSFSINEATTAKELYETSCWQLKFQEIRSPMKERIQKHPSGRGEELPVSSWRAS